jgi:phospholipid/cholesterol/gamma-HCH transport system substrate-binding protein
MARNHEEIKVGIMVLVAGALFLTALVFVGGVNLLRKKKVEYTTYFKFAGGISPGSFVRFGGLKVGSVESAKIDPEDSTRIKVVLQVAQDTPVRTNSKARISTLGFLGENYVEVSAGTRDAALLPPNSEIPSVEIVQIADVFNNVNNITVNANKLVNDLDDRVLVLADGINQLLNNLNATVSKENRDHLTKILAQTDAMITETRPRLASTLDSIDAASKKLGPTIDKTNGTIAKADVLIGNLNGVVEENRKQIHELLLQLHATLLQAQQMLGNTNDLLDNNRENLDEAIENIRITTENLKEFTETVKQHPYSLIRIKTEKDRLPPTGK